MTRSKHLAWAKERAMEYLPDNPTMAFTSLGSDFSKHDDLRNHAGLQIGMMMLMMGKLQTAPDMRRFIEGFN